MPILVKIDGARIEAQLARLAEITATPGAGVTRLPFSPEMRAAAVLLSELMAEAGMQVHTDASGAVIGTLPGKSPDALVIASHYDTVLHGGAYDGIAGVVCGIEIAHVLARTEPERPLTLRIVATNDEEGARFGTGFFSAKAFLGQLAEDDLRTASDADSTTLWDAMESWGLNPARLRDAAWDLSHVRAFFEIHIEQGPVLERERAELGVVSGIVGMCRRMVTVHGATGHAGTVPMDCRCDAVEIAAKCISQVGDIARRFEGAVATVGHITVSPNAINTIADSVSFSLDTRSLDAEAVETINRLIDDELRRLEIRSGAWTESVTTLCQPSSPMHPELQRLLLRCARERGRSVRVLPSGAGHDSLPMAAAVPTAMLFVPSRGGVSHCPEEWSSPVHLAHAAEVLLDAVKTLMEVDKNELS